MEEEKRRKRRRTKVKTTREKQTITRDCKLSGK
jgi:hypothetical protein